jgi:hypothetical protein
MTTTRTPEVRTAEGRAEFAEVFARFHDKPTGYDAPEIRRLVQAYVDDLYLELRRVSPRAKVKREADWDRYPQLEVNELARRIGRKGGASDVTRLRDVHHPRIEGQVSALCREVDALRKRLNELAPLAEVRRAGSDGDWYPLALRTSWDYSTQGYGAGKYAEGAVQFTADVARALGFVDGVDLVVLRVPYHTEDAWLAAVRVEDEIDVEIVKRSPPPPLREQVRLAWKRGVNPRVYNPFLPHGYEAQVGIDYFGRDLRATAPTTTQKGAAQ